MLRQCSITSRSTPGMSVAIHTKILVFTWRNSTNWVLNCSLCSLLTYTTREALVKSRGTWTVPLQALHTIAFVDLRGWGSRLIWLPWVFAWGSSHSIALPRPNHLVSPQPYGEWGTLSVGGRSRPRLIKHLCLVSLGWHYKLQKF